MSLNHVFLAGYCSYDCKFAIVIKTNFSLQDPHNVTQTSEENKGKYQLRILSCPVLLADFDSQ